MSGYIGTQPVPQATQTRDAFTATNNQTSFATSGYTPEFLDVFLNGVKLAASDYTATNGSDVVLASGAAASDILEVVAYSTFEVLNPTFDGNVTFTGNASFGDNDKAIFGDGNDLQIYHDGFNNYIEGSTGSLIIQNTLDDYNVIIKSDNGSGGMTDYFRAKGDTGSALMYHYGSEKLATTSTGVNVTGAVTSTGLIGNATNFDIKQNTSDGSDSKRTRIGGGGDVVSSRGAMIEMSGNEHGNGGMLFLHAGHGGAYSQIRSYTANTERMRIDSSGRAMLGTTTAGTGGAEQFTVASSGNTGITIRAGASSGSAIYMSDATSGSGEYAGYISYSHGSNAMTFASNSSERMRIDSSGNLLVGMTSNGITSTGIGLVRDGTSHMYSGGTHTLELGRGASDGDILKFNRSGSTVGSIGAFYSNLTIGRNGGAKLAFDSSVIYSTNDSGTTENNVYDLGTSSSRFKDLYLGGGVYLGGVGSANKLDDYEEGNHTTTITPGTSGTVSMNGGANEMSYTKIGRLVTVTGDVRISSVSSPVGHTKISLPFAVTNTTDLAERGGLVMLVWSGNWNHVTATYSDNQTYIIVDITPAAGLEYRFSFSYITS